MTLKISLTLTLNRTKSMNISETLNGEMRLIQNNKRIQHGNITTETTIDQKLDIRPEDLRSIENATSTVVHWFIDCQYVRQTKELQTQHIFMEPNKTHEIEALVESTFESNPLKSVPTLKSKLISNWRQQHKSDLPYICHNQSHISPDPNKVYGYFRTNITVFGKLMDFS